VDSSMPADEELCAQLHHSRKLLTQAATSLGSCAMLARDPTLIGVVWRCNLPPKPEVK